MSRSRTTPPTGEKPNSSMTEAPIGRREESHRRYWRVAEQIGDVSDIAGAIMHLEAVPFVQVKSCT
jgi:hypothetical protein